MDHSSDVKVEILIAGDGKNYPTAGNTVIIHYDAFLPNGVRFDSSRERNRPFQFKLFSEQVIQGLDEGVSQLSTGERAMIGVGSAKGYGERGFPCLVPKNADLRFDVELIRFDARNSE